MRRKRKFSILEKKKTWFSAEIQDRAGRLSLTERGHYFKFRHVKYFSWDFTISDSQIGVSWCPSLAQGSSQGCQKVGIFCWQLESEIPVTKDFSSCILIQSRKAPCRRVGITLGLHAGGAVRLGAEVLFSSVLEVRGALSLVLRTIE
jgi:hypothetical protein